MPTLVERDEVRPLVEQGAQLVDVLPAAEYEELRIAGAVNVPLRELDALAPAQLDRGRPVIVYCNDHY